MPLDRRRDLHLPRPTALPGECRAWARQGGLASPPQQVMERLAGLLAWSSGVGLRAQPLVGRDRRKGGHGHAVAPDHGCLVPLESRRPASRRCSEPYPREPLGVAPLEGMRTPGARSRYGLAAVWHTAANPPEGPGCAQARGTRPLRTRARAEALSKWQTRGTRSTGAPAPGPTHARQAIRPGRVWDRVDPTPLTDLLHLSNAP